MTDQLVSLAAAALRVGVSERSIRRRLDDPLSGLHHYRIGRRRLLSAAELEVWVPPAATPTSTADAAPNQCNRGVEPR